jgi:hypothetical protein
MQRERDADSHNHTMGDNTGGGAIMLWPIRFKSVAEF